MIKIPSEVSFVGIIANMTIVSLRFVGRFLYFIGGLILIPVGAIFVASPNTLMLAGPVVLLIPVAGSIFALAGKWMTHKAQLLEAETKAKSIIPARK